MRKSVGGNVYKSLSLGMIAVILFFTMPPVDPVLGQEGVDTPTKVRHLLQEANGLVAQIKSLEDQWVVLSRIGETSWRAGDKTTATESFDKALKIVDVLPQEDPDLDLRDSYRESIAILRARVGDIEGAQETLLLIKSDFEKSFVISEVALAQARAKKFAEAVHTASGLQESDSREQQLAWISSIEADAGETQGATQLARTIKNAQYRAEALGHIAALSADEGPAEEVHASIKEALVAADQTESREEGGGRSSLGGCFSEEPEQPRNEALERVARAQARAGETEAALETVKRMHDKTGSENVLATIAGYQARAGDFEGARASIAGISRDTCKATALHFVVMAQFEAGNLSAALLTANEMTNPEQKAGTLMYLAEQLVNQGSFNSAVTILVRARVFARSVPDDLSRAEALEGISSLQAKAGNRDEAAKSLAEAMPSAIAAREDAKRNHGWNSALPDLIERQTELGDLDGAWATLVNLDGSDRMKVVSNVARIRSKADDLQGALAWAGRQVSPRDKAVALVGAAQGVLERFEPENN